ncbi:MAG: hypothetical protein WCJ30_06235 [Deltaproteobacteria bacterium]
MGAGCGAEMGRPRGEGVDAMWTLWNASPMVTNGCEFDKAYSLEPDIEINIAAGYLVKLGYTLADARAEDAARGARRQAQDYRSSEPEKHPMIPCPYCGKINVATLPGCTSCGAPVR